jgi:hypothetical protein
MALPETLCVKLSSEAAGYLSVTPVVVRQMPVRELIEMALGLTGKDLARLHELLLRGTLVSGASRLRWTGWDAEPAALQAALDNFPDPDPARSFAPERCVRAVLKGVGHRIEIPREVGSRKKLFRRRSFWDVLMALAAQSAPRYLEYSYRERADCYLADLSPAAARDLRQQARLLKYSRLENQLGSALLDSIEFYVKRSPDRGL